MTLREDILRERLWEAGRRLVEVSSDRIADGCHFLLECRTCNGRQVVTLSLREIIVAHGQGGLVGWLLAKLVEADLGCAHRAYVTGAVDPLDDDALVI